MIQHGRRDTRHSTGFISINTKLCQACWKCIDVCENNVIGKINMLFHKHAVIRHSEECKGCDKCVHACPHEAITRISDHSSI